MLCVLVDAGAGASHSFDADIDFLNPPNDLSLGEVTGVAVNSKKQIFVV